MRARTSPTRSVFNAGTAMSAIVAPVTPYGSAARRSLQPRPESDPASQVEKTKVVCDLTSYPIDHPGDRHRGQAHEGPKYSIQFSLKPCEAWRRVFVIVVYPLFEPLNALFQRALVSHRHLLPRRPGPGPASRAVVERS